MDRSPDYESKDKAESTNVLTGQYDENWENLRKIVEPSSSKSVAVTSQSKKEKVGKHHRRTKRAHGEMRKSSSGESSTSSSSASSSPTHSENSCDQKEVAMAIRAHGRMKFQ